MPECSVQDPRAKQHLPVIMQCTAVETGVPNLTHSVGFSAPLLWSVPLAVHSACYASAQAEGRPIQVQRLQSSVEVGGVAADAVSPRVRLKDQAIIGLPHTY